MVWAGDIYIWESSVCRWHVKLWDGMNSPKSSE